MQASRGLQNLTVLALLAVAAVYAAVWGHEIGHSLAAWAEGCKDDPWRTSVTPFLWGSRGGAIDEVCLSARGAGAVATVALAGIASNLAAVGLALLGFKFLSPRRRWLLVAILLGALANAAEAFSYLVLNTIWLRSDLSAAVGALGGRWIFLGLGLAGAAAVAVGLAGPMRTAARSLASPGLPERFFRLSFALYALAVAALAAIERVSLG